MLTEFPLVDLNFWQQYVLLHGVCSPLIAEACAWSIVNLTFHMGLQSKVLTCKKCQFSNREVSALQSKSCWNILALSMQLVQCIISAAFPSSQLLGIPTLRGTEQIFKPPATWMSDEAFTRSGCALLAVKLLTYLLRGYRALGWICRLLFLPEVSFGEIQWRSKQLWEVSSLPQALGNFAFHKSLRKSPSLGESTWLGFFSPRLSNPPLPGKMSGTAAEPATPGKSCFSCCHVAKIMLRLPA